MTAVVCVIILFTRFVKCFISFAAVLGRENVICELIKVRYKSVFGEENISICEENYMLTKDVNM